MKTKIEKTVCDVCAYIISTSLSEKENPSARLHQVIFTTEQTEGRTVKPYLSQKTLDLCDTCESKMLEGNMLFGAGAMGYNTYHFKKRESP